MTDDARPEPSGLTAVDKYDLDYHLFRHRLVWAIAIAVLAVTGFTVLLVTVAAERYYRLDSLVLAVPACWTAAVIVYAYGARRLTRVRSRVRVAVTIVMGVGVALVWPSAVGAHTLTTLREGESVESPDGRYTLVAQRFTNVIDPSCRVWLRENNGPLSRQALVWERIEAPCPEAMAFLDNDRFLIRVGDYADGEAHTWNYDPDIMRVYPAD